MRTPITKNLQAPASVLRSRIRVVAVMVVIVLTVAVMVVMTRMVRQRCLGLFDYPCVLLSLVSFPHARLLPLCLLILLLIHIFLILFHKLPYHPYSPFPLIPPSVRISCLARNTRIHLGRGILRHRSRRETCGTVPRAWTGWTHPWIVLCCQYPHVVDYLASGTHPFTFLRSVCAGSHGFCIFAQMFRLERACFRKLHESGRQP